MSVRPSPTGGDARPGTDPKHVHPLAWGIVVAGVLIFGFSLTSYYTFAMKRACVTVGPGRVCAGGGNAGNWTAWHGYFGWLATVLAMLGSVLVAVELFMPQAGPPRPTRLVGLIAYALATLSVVLALVVIPDPHGIRGFDKGHGFGYWISLILILAGLAMSLVRSQQADGEVPQHG
jgi:hypothetical protein